MEWSTDTKTGYDDLEVYMGYGYVFVSSTGRNNVKMAALTFCTIDNNGFINLLSLEMGMVCTVMLTSYYDNQCRCNINEVFYIILGTSYAENRCI